LAQIGSGVAGSPYAEMDTNNAIAISSVGINEQRMSHSSNSEVVRSV
jgi:hypothetical protein